MEQSGKELKAVKVRWRVRPKLFVLQGEDMAAACQAKVAEAGIEIAEGNGPGVTGRQGAEQACQWCCWLWCTPGNESKAETEK